MKFPVPPPSRQTDPVMDALAQTKRMQAANAIARAEARLEAAQKELTNTPYTVADMRADLDTMPDDAEIWAESHCCGSFVTGMDWSPSAQVRAGTVDLHTD